MDPKKRAAKNLLKTRSTLSRAFMKFLRTSPDARNVGLHPEYWKHVDRIRRVEFRLFRLLIGEENPLYV